MEAIGTASIQPLSYLQLLQAVPAVNTIHQVIIVLILLLAMVSVSWAWVDMDKDSDGDGLR